MSSDSSADRSGEPSPRSARWNLSTATALNALATLSIQVVALTTLTPIEFGTFSIQYLLFALGTSVALSVVSEAWQRRHRNTGKLASWPEFASVSLYIAIGSGLVTLLVSMFSEPLRSIAVVGAVAVAASTYRGTVRYFYLRNRMWKESTLPDAIGFAITIAFAVFMIATANTNLQFFAYLWATASLATAVSAGLPRLQHPRVAWAWVKDHKEEIKPLLRDSILMDLGAVGTPYVLAPVLGLTQFGTYRAVSNVAAPVRLILNPLRPTLSNQNLASHRSPKRILIPLACSLAFGAAAYLALGVIGWLSIDLGVLKSVADFALPTALFVTANFLGHYYYIISRTHLDPDRLLAGRIVQTALAVVLPVALGLAGGLGAAIWGLALATLLSSATWASLVLLPRRLSS